MVSHNVCTLVLTTFASQLATDWAARMKMELEVSMSGGDELDANRDFAISDTPVFQRHAEDGIELLNYEFTRQHTFQIAISKNGIPPASSMLEPAMLVLTKERAFAFLGSSRPKRQKASSWFWGGNHSDSEAKLENEMPYCDDDDTFENCNYHDETSSVDTATITIETFYEPEEGATLSNNGMENCMSLTGCSTANCDDPFQVWLLCTHLTHVLLEFSLLFDELYCTRNNLQDRLGPEIVRAAGQALQPSFEAFSPFIISDTSSDFGRTELDKVKVAFASRVMPYRPGQNSRSGASFFWSKDRLYIAKRIRGWEFNELWQAMSDGLYRDRILQGISVMNPIYLAFMWGSVPWIVMLTARMPEEVTTYIKTVHRFSVAHVLDQPRIRKFKMDIKVRPMTSDRIKMLQFALREHALKNALDGTSQAWLDSSHWARLESRVHSDVEYLESKNLVDYSFLVHGIVFERPVSRGTLGGPEAKRFGTMMRAVEARPDCTIDCPLHEETRHQRRLVDVTENVERVNNQIVVQKATYKCCCAKLPNWDGAVVRSPCVLVNTAAPQQKLFAVNRTGCDNLLEGKWHTYSSVEKLPLTNGRCLVGVGIWSASTFNPGETSDHGSDQLFIDPVDAFGIEIPRVRPTCSVVCVNVLDYLLPLNFWNTVENVLLIPRYFGAKWTNYGQRMMKLLQCMAEAPLRFKRSGLHQLATVIGSYRPMRDPARSNYTIERDMVKAESVVSASDCEAVMDDEDTPFIRSLFEDLLIKRKRAPT